MTYVVVDVVPDTPEWLEERRSSLGASEVAAVLGLSPWEDDTALSVYRSKLGIDRAFDPERAFFGHRLEAVMEDWLTLFRPLELPRVLPGFMARSIEYPWLHASFDRLADHAGILAPIQIKTDASFGGMKKWADGVPLWVQAQVQAEIAVLDAPHGWSLTFVGAGMKGVLHRIDRDQEWIDNYLVPLTRSFWSEHVTAKIPPAVVSAGEHALAWSVAPGKSIEVTPVLSDALDERSVLLSDALAQEKEAKTLRDQADAIQTEILNFAQDAQFLTVEGAPVWEIGRRSRRSVSVSTVEDMHPELLPDLVKTSHWSILQPVKPKKESVSD